MRSLVLIVALSLAAPASAQTFRWSVGKLECGYGLEIRSNGGKCRSRDPYLVVAYPGIVIRYDGDSPKAPQRWAVDYVATKPVVVVHGAAIAIASVERGRISVQTFDAATGKRLASTTLSNGVTDIQVESVGAVLRIYTRTDAGGEILDLDAKLDVTASHIVKAAEIRVTQDPSASPADGEATAGAVKVAWDGTALVLHAGTARVKLLDDERFRMQLVTMHASGDRVLVTLHHPMASGTNAFAFDAKTGAQLWATHATGLGAIAHSAYYNKVSSRLDGDQLIVQGVEAGGAFVCTIAIADGAELACVDGMTGTAVFDPPPPTVVVKAVPRATPLGPQTTSVKCKRTKSPRSALVLRPWRSGPVSGTVTSPSASCKPKLFGGIAGDRIEIIVHDGRATGPDVCECTLGFRQETNGDSRVVIGKHANVELAQQPLTARRSP